jgi:hypothetical protein
MGVRRIRQFATAVAAVVAAWYALAYLVLPGLWYHREHQPGLEGKPAVTETAQGIPGDPLNVGLVGERTEVLLAMHRAGWFPADPVTLESSVEIAASVVLDRPYVDAPVSPLFYEGRKQDFAFEKSIGESADRRNHVRFWKVLDKGVEGRPVWLGSATLDRSVGLSHDTAQITHHIAPDVDDERDRLIADLTAARTLTTIYQVSGVGPTVNGRNGEGDRYYTDGEIRIGVITAGAAPVDAEPVVDPDPPIVATKNGLWKSVTDAVAPDGPDDG